VHPESRIFVAGAATLAGRALLECLQGRGYCNLVGQPPTEPELTCAGQVDDFFDEYRPEYVFLTAGLSGGIQANCDRPADLMLDNLLTAAYVTHAAHVHGASRLLYLASSCIYPRLAPQPLREESLLTGLLEPTNDAYAMAKLAGWKLCQAYRQQHGARFLTAIAANPFGPGDDFMPASGHVIPALMRRLHEAKENGDAEVTAWGSGRPVRDFLYSRDLAEACLFVMAHYDDLCPVNVSGGAERTVAETAHLIAEVVGYRGCLRFDQSRPDGMPRKVLDGSRLRALGWRPSTDFRTELEETYAWFVKETCCLADGVLECGG
jgi:GDP-L-fucose synthase